VLIAAFLGGHVTVPMKAITNRNRRIDHDLPQEVNEVTGLCVSKLVPERWSSLEPG
jgi:hypothetical protein